MKGTANILIGPALFALSVWLLPFTFQQNAALGVVCWMIYWWSAQAIPIGATSLLPLVLFPATGVLDISAVATNYANPIIYLFLGGFVIGLAVEKWGLHKRLALIILRYSGERPTQVVAGFMGATALLSMWISNTAATVMMLPIALSVIALLETNFSSKKVLTRFAISLLLGLAFGANVGGMATLIGTPPNLVLAGVVSTQLGIELGFGQWLLFALPLTVILFLAILFVNTVVVFRIPRFRMVGLRENMGVHLQLLGPMLRAERRVAMVFGATALLWIFRSALASWAPLAWLSDALIGICGAIAMFVVRDGKGEGLMTWPDMERMPWDILLLFGGGLSIAAGLTASGCVALLGEAMQGISGVEWIWVVLIVTSLAVFLTELMSNVALVAMLLPIAVGVAPALGGNPLELAIPLTLGASCAFMLPIATPPNAIVFGANYIRMADMARAGIWLNVLSIAVIAAYCHVLIKVFF